MQAGEYKEVKKYDMQIPYNHKKWNILSFDIIDSKLSVLLNNKDLLVDVLEDEAFANLEGGTLGMGSNIVQTEFADISLGVLSPDSFTTEVESLLKTKDVKSAKKEAEAALTAEISSSEDIQEAVVKVS